MVGVITRWDILAHPISTIRCFGWLVFFKAVVSWHGETFLSILQDAGLFAGDGQNSPAILKRCIALELRAKRIYKALAVAFATHEPVGPFFSALVLQEQYHADLLEVCRAAVLRGGWKTAVFSPWEKQLPLVERQMDATEAAIYHIDSVDAALQLVVQVEGSEINQVFCAALAATDSVFVRKIKSFREAMQSHMAFLVDWIPELSPQQQLMIDELRAVFPGLRE